MSPCRLHRRLTAWIALVAMLAFALVPTLSRAMAFASGSSTWAEICTPQGMKLVSSTDADGQGLPLQASASLDACAFCALGTDGAAPLHSNPLPLRLPLHSAEVPRLFLQAERTPHAWRSAQPRAPPLRG